MGWFSLLSLLFFLLPFSSFQTSSNVSSSSIIHHPSPLCHPYERSALIQFKNSFSVNNTFASFYYDYECDGIDPPTVSWAKNDASNCCAWRGVTCDEKAGHVIGLDLSCARLQGAFHSNSTLFFLRNLQSLYLLYNDFGGSTIPSEFGKFTNLEHLILSDSNFSGNVPPEISYLSKLVKLDLSYNNILLKVDTFTLKRTVTNLTNLEALYLSRVDMSSVSPVVLMNLSSSLINLTLSFSSLGGNLPADYIFRLPKLEMLSLFRNENLTGSLFPKSNRNTSSPLKELDPSETKLSIDFPYLFQNFKYSLEYLYLGSCKILGWNPTLLANLTQISELYLYSNNLGGEIPWSSLMHLERLIGLDLS
nr:receptor-like protein Cf-9 homolog [Ziziphus jujuba var. spinosa]